MRVGPILILLSALIGCENARAQGHSGIPEIDTLPLNDWNRSPEPLSYGKTITLSALLPGAGQIYGSHPVRGGFLIGLETLLGGLALYSELVDVPHWREQARNALDSADAYFIRANALPDSAKAFDSRRQKHVAFARERSQLASQQEDLAHSQLAWAVGLHLYGVLDAAEIAYLSRHRDTESRSVKRAMLYGMAFPGAAQLYNRRYGKFGMLWMAIGASAVSAYSRQQMVDLLNDRIHVARGEAAANLEDLEKDRTLYRKRRNQYFWGMALFYVYAVLDGMVDASLSDFDAPQHFAVLAGPEGTIACEWNIPF
jgi:TM2 domain-containing membrane protein YozV